MAQPTALSEAFSARTGLAPTLVADKLAAHLRQHPADAEVPAGEAVRLERILASLLVHETYFYRHLDQWRLLRDAALPALLAERGGATLTAWCAGCATGEEVWSLAHLSRLFPQARFDILGSDISAASIATAEAGLYRRLLSMGSFRELPDFARADFPALPGEMWEAPAAWRQAVRFAVHNVMDPPPLARADLVFCRNLLIYFTPEAAQSVIRHIATILAPGGLLVMGPVETPRLMQWFAPINGADAIIYRRTDYPV